MKQIQIPTRYQVTIICRIHHHRTAMMFKKRSVDYRYPSELAQIKEQRLFLKTWRIKGFRQMRRKPGKSKVRMGLHKALF